MYTIKMPNKDTQFTRKELIIIAENSGTKEPHKMSTSDLVKTLTRHEKKRISRNICRRFSQLAQTNINKRQNPSKSDLRKARTLKNKLLSNLKNLLNYEESRITTICQKKT